MAEPEAGAVGVPGVDGAMPNMTEALAAIATAIATRFEIPITAGIDQSVCDKVLAKLKDYEGEKVLEDCRGSVAHALTALVSLSTKPESSLTMSRLGWLSHSKAL